MERKKLLQFQDIDKEVNALSKLQKLYNIIKTTGFVLFLLSLLWGALDAAFWFTDLEALSLIVFPLLILVTCAPTILLMKIIVILYQSLVNISTNVYMIRSDVESLANKE